MNARSPGGTEDVACRRPGGTEDVACRRISGRLSERLGQPFTVDNRPGAASMVAAKAVDRAPPDGDTLLFDATVHSVNPSLFGNRRPYDTEKDLLPVFLSPVFMSMVTPNTVMCRQAFEARTIQKLVALAKTQPGRLDRATTGIGTVQHVSLESLNQIEGIQVNHIPYREIAAARNDVISDPVALPLGNGPGSLTLLQSGRVRCRAHCGPPGALAVLPGAPAMAETLPGFEAWEWNGIVAPAGTATESIQGLNAARNAGVEEPAVRERLNGLGAPTHANTITAFAACRRQQITVFERDVAIANIRVDRRTGQCHRVPLTSGRLDPLTGGSAGRGGASAAPQHAPHLCPRSWSGPGRKRDDARQERMATVPDIGEGPKGRSPKSGIAWRRDSALKSTSESGVPKLGLGTPL